MNLIAALPLLVIFTVFSTSAEAQNPPNRQRALEASDATGRLVIIGGGSIPEDVWSAVLKDYEPKAARVCVLPFASELPDTFARAEARFRERGVLEIFQIPSRPSDEELKLLHRADVIWIPGGAQGRFMEAISQSLATAITERFQTGATIAGTSAGAAVASRLMIAGNATGERGENSAVPELARGLGLLPQALVDQHFTERRRLPRLLAAVLKHPELLGIGIDESTAAVISGQTLAVVGSGTVTILDARSAKLTRNGAEKVATRNLALHILGRGESFDFSARTAAR